MKPKYVTCPRCGGSPDFDEDGRPYTCYFCCDTGSVTEEIATEEARGAAWAYYVSTEAAIIKRAKLGIPPGWRWYFDQETGELVKVLPRGAVATQAADAWEDIPF